MRLTNDYRNAIRNLIIDKKFDKKRAKLKDREYLLAKQIRLLVLNGQDALINSLPATWVKNYQQISIYGKSGSWHERYVFDFSADAKETMRLPFNVDIPNVAEISEKDKHLGERVCRYLDDKKEMEQEIQEMQHSLNSTLRSFGTTETMLKEFPELTGICQSLKLESVMLPAKTNYNTIHGILKGL